MGTPLCRPSSKAPSTVKDPVYNARAQVAGLARRRPADDPELAQARHDLQVANLERAVQRAVDAAPPLTEQQRNKIAALLRPTAVAG